MIFLEQVRNGVLKIKGRNVIRLVRLEAYYKESRHEPGLISSIAESIVQGLYYKDLDIIYRCIEKPHKHLCIYTLKAPVTCFKDLIILDYSILIEETGFLDTHSKLRDDLLLEIETYAR